MESVPGVSALITLSGLSSSVRVCQWKVGTAVIKCNLVVVKYCTLKLTDDVILGHPKGMGC